MADENNKEQFQDFGVDDSAPAEKPKINNYAEKDAPQNAAATDPAATTPNPAGNPPPTPPNNSVDQSPAPAPTSATAAAPAAAATPAKPAKPAKKPADPAFKKKILIGFFGISSVILLIFMVISFLFLAQPDQESNPIAKLLGLNPASFVNGLITFIHILFFLIALIIFSITMIGLFKAAMAKKDDKETKKKGLKMTVIGAIFLLVIVITWVFAGIYLDSKRVRLPGEILEPVITTPLETLSLSAPVEIKFDASNVPVNRNKYQIVSHNWDFDDGDTGTAQIVSHIYDEKGTFDVKLEVMIRDKKTQEIAVGGEYHVTVSVTNQALTASFEADPQSGEAPLEVKFDASKSVDPDGNIATYEWDLDGDDEFDDAEGETAEYEFEKIGKHTVSLRVTNSIGEFDVSEKDIDVKEKSLPEAVITEANTADIYEVGKNYIFKADDSTSPNGKITGYEWDFGDGSRPETTKTAAHSFDGEGSYVVVLTVTDEKDKESSSEITVNVGALRGAPKANITTTPGLAGDSRLLDGKVPFTVVFDASGSTDSDGNIVDYTWNFGDGSEEGAGKEVSHTYNDQGTYTATLTVSDADDNDSITTQIIQVTAQGIIAAVDADPIEGSVPLTVSFDASASTYDENQITSYKWDFGDGTNPKLGGAQITHKYKEIGNYPVVLTVIGADNNQAIKELTITVREIPLQACFLSVFEQGPAPLQTTFDPSCSTGTISRYFWDFGDGTTSTKVKPNHVFETPGEYQVKLEISDSDSNIGKADLQINVTE
jgi:PKD repeat protein